MHDAPISRTDVNAATVADVHTATVPDDTDMSTICAADIDILLDVEGSVSADTMSAHCVCTYHYHIVYSSSYMVPVLYFNVYKSGIVHRGDLILIKSVFVDTLIHLVYCI